ncbi:unnamed protein product [Knipowitschia caucasica]|uniref:Ubiquitin-like domain-containing protein n=1 Tax=Knipowitschia caucasica TaxID=637954 RepID=A0AAV2KMH3_KNICA
MGVQLIVCLPDSDEKLINVCDKEDELKKITVLDLKRKIIQQLSIQNDIRLTFHGETLNETQPLKEYGIRHLSTIHTLLILHGGI